MTNLTIPTTSTPIEIFPGGLVEGLPIKNSSEVCTVGEFMRVEVGSSSTGKLMRGNGSSATEVGTAAMHGIALSTGANGTAPALLRWGIMNVGAALDALDYGAAVYLSDTDGKLADSAGTVSKVVGRVWPVFASDSGTAQKALYVDLR